jgi:septal ring factor EnvC (AmiA/AmiB activator)
MLFYNYCQSACDRCWNCFTISTASTAAAFCAFAPASFAVRLDNDEDNQYPYNQRYYGLYDRVLRLEEEENRQLRKEIEKLKEKKEKRKEVDDVMSLFRD